MFKEKLKEVFDSKLKIAATICSVVWFILYFALGANIFDNMWNTSPALPFIGGVFALIPIILQTVNLLFWKNKWLDICVIAESLAFSLVHFFFFAFVLSKLSYFLITGTDRKSTRLNSSHQQ